MPPSPHSAPTSKLSPLYVPVSPDSRAKRCKPCPVALVPTLGCSRPLPPSLLLLASALSGNIRRDMCFWCNKNGPYIRTRLVIPQEKNKHTGSTTPTDETLSLEPRRAAACAVGERRSVYPCLHPCPRTHVEIRGRNGPGRRAPKTLHTPDPHMYCCC